MHFLQTLHSSGLKLDNHRGKCVGFGLKILHKTLHRVGLRGGVCRGRGEAKNINVGLGGNMQKRGFHPTFLLFEGTCVAEKSFAYSARSLLRSAPSFS